LYRHREVTAELLSFDDYDCPFSSTRPLWGFPARVIAVQVARQTRRRRIFGICKAFIYNGMDKLRCLCLHFLPRRSIPSKAKAKNVLN
jgi:hypothetical protein